MKLKKEVEERIKRIVKENNERDVVRFESEDVNGIGLLFIRIINTRTVTALELNFNTKDKELIIYRSSSSDLNFTRDKDLLQLIENNLKCEESWER